MKKLELNISRIPYYALYEVCNKPDTIEERFLDDDDKIVDIIAIWAKETEDFTSRKQTIDFRIYLKIMFFYEFSENDIDTVTMNYVQTSYDINIGKYNLNQQDVITLGAIQLLVNFGNEKEKAFRHLDDNVISYIAANHYKNNTPMNWVKKVMELYEGLNISSKIEAKLSYLEHLKNNPLYEAHQF